MIRAVVAGLGFISVLAALIIVALLMVNSLGGSLAGGSAANAPSEGAAESVVLRTRVHLGYSSVAATRRQRVPETLAAPLV